MGEFALGQAVPRFEDPRLIRGGGRYADDVHMPGMAYGYVLRSPHGHAQIRVDRHQRAPRRRPACWRSSPAPTGQASGWAICRPWRAETARRRRHVKPRYPALAEDSVRWVGDYVAFIVAETRRRRGRRRADRGRLRAAARGRLRPPTRRSPARRASGTTAPTTSVRPSRGDKAATEPRFAKADHIVKRRFVINRVTAATMEPRGAVGDYDKAEDATRSTPRCSARTASAPNWRRS